MGVGAAYAGIPMSAQNLRVIDEVFEQFNRTGQPTTNSMHPEIEWVPIREDPDFEVRRGTESVHRYLAGWGETFDELRAERLETTASGEKVFVWIRLTGKGRGSEFPIKMEQGIVYTFRDGKIASGTEFTDRAEGRRAAGLE